MPDSSSSVSFDWLSNHAPAFAAQEFWDNGRYDEPAAFCLLYETTGPFTIACGIGLLAEHVRKFRFSPDVIQRMGQITDIHGRSILHESFLNYLQRMHLRVQINAVPEGTLLCPGEPVLTIRGPLVQIQLLESALQLLCWESTHWATQAALARWKNKDWEEEDTPTLTAYSANPKGWRKRAAYIGGATLEQLEHLKPHVFKAGSILKQIEHATGAPLVQIRRLFKGNQPLGDVWLSAAKEEAASVSKSSISFHDLRTRQGQTVKFTRFQNLYQAALSKGHPVLPASRPAYFRQRTLKQLEAFYAAGLEEYLQGWMNVVEV